MPGNEQQAPDDLNGIHRQATLTSTVPENGDQNPYAIVVAPVSAGAVQKDDVLVTNLSLNVAAYTSVSLRTVDGPWADQVKLHTVSKIKKRIPSVQH